MLRQRAKKKEVTIEFEDYRIEPQALVNDCVVATIPATFFSLFHTIVVFATFFGSLALGCYYHYEKIVKNEHFGHPEEWFPSISATIGDWAPERNFFHIGMALASGPRFFLVICSYFAIKSGLSRSRESGVGLNQFLLVLGIIRTFAAGGWIFVTSNDDHFVHDVTMISYLIVSFIYYLLSTFLISKSKVNHSKVVGVKLFITFLFIVNLGPLIYFFLQHKEHQVPGAYTIYAFFEWSLVLLDVGFDATSFGDFTSMSLQLVDEHAETEAERQKNARYRETEEKHREPSNSDIIRKYIVDIYLGYLSWSIFTSLIVCIWFFPLFDMALSGFEISLIASFAAGLNGIVAVRHFVQQNRGVMILFSLIGVAAYAIQDPAQRLGVVGIGVAFDSLVVTSVLWDPTKKDHAVTTYLLGLILFLIVKVFYVTNNPIWPTMDSTNGGHNIMGIALGVICAVEVMFRRNEKPTFDTGTPSKKKGKWYTSAISFGCLLFLTQNFFTDYSVISNWVVVGFPNTGPLPYPWGLLVIVAAVLGLLLASQPWVPKVEWFGVGMVGAILLYYAPTYIGFFGGLLLAVYIFSIWPVVVNKMVNHNPGRTLLLAMFVYIIYLLASVWVVAFPFVPLGEFLRERIQVVVISALILVYLGARDGQPLFSQFASIYADQLQKRLLLSSFGLLILLSIAGISRFNPNLFQNDMVLHENKVHKDNKLLTVGIWTIHFGYDNEMYFSHDRMKNAMELADADVWGLLESDMARPIMGNRDIAQWLSESMEFYYDYGPATRNHTWGCAMLSKFPIKWSEHHLLPSPEGEIACAIHATIDYYGTDVDIVIGHNGNEEHTLDRKLQVEELARIMKGSPNPLIYAGYVVASPHSDNYKILVEGSGVKDIDPTDDDRWCQYLLYKDVQKIGYARITHGGITDTEIQLGKFIIGTGEDNIEEIEEEKAPEFSRFPEVFKGEGKDGHHYHVFDKPKYFGPRVIEEIDHSNQSNEPITTSETTTEQEESV